MNITQCKHWQVLPYYSSVPSFSQQGDCGAYNQTLLHCYCFDICCFGVVSAGPLLVHLPPWCRFEREISFFRVEAAPNGACSLANRRWPGFQSLSHSQLDAFHSLRSSILAGFPGSVLLGLRFHYTSVGMASAAGVQPHPFSHLQLQYSALCVNQTS